MPSYHFRYTPNDIEAYDLIHFVEPFTKYVVGREYKSPQKQGLHFHIYLETELTKDTVVNYARKYLNIPTGKRGVANKYFMCKEWDTSIDYFCKSGDVVVYMGYTLADIQSAQQNGFKKWIHDVKIAPHKPTAGETASGGPAPASPKEAKTTEWEYLLESSEGIGSTLSNPKKSVKQWKSWIVYQYISRLKAIPRTGDLNRYANSLYILHTSKMLCDEKHQKVAENLCENYVEELEQNKNLY